MEDRILQCTSEPGVQLDGTSFDSNNFIDSQWCRFYRGKPQKIGGYQKMTSWDNHIPRGIFVVPNAPLFNVYIGDSHALKYFPVDGQTGLPVGPLVDRTPLLFNQNDNNEWNFDIMYDATTFNSSVLIAFASRNLYAIDQTVESPVYYGSAQSDARLIETGIRTSGGILALHPYLIAFGNDGNVSWTEAGNPTSIADSDRITGSKIITGAQVRGGTNSPAGLLWSLDSLIRVTQVGTNSGPEFSFDTVTSESSILSNNCVVELDSFYYWAGVDKFYVYNGTVQELPNAMCLEYFFDNLNFSQRQKVWATKIPKYGEIWFFYPHGDSVECNRAVVYNARLRIWYPNIVNRACGHFNPVFGKPIWGANNLNGAIYEIWRHEIGLDRVVDGVATPIDSYFETSVMSWVSTAPGGQPSNVNKSIDLYEFEPDFVQSGDIALTVKGRAYAHSNVETSNDYVFNNDPLSANYKEKVDIHEQRRLMTLKFRSNTLGGNYKMGKCLLVPRYGDMRP